MKNLILAVAVFAGANQAIAGPLDSPSANSSTSSASSWDGFYLGLSVSSADVGGFVPGIEFGTQGLGFQAGYLRGYGSVLLGGELAYVSSEFDDAAIASLSSTRLKMIGGYDAGRFMPYAFLGLSDVELGLDTIGSANDTGVNYGLGGRVALGAQGKVIAGLEYLIEEVNDFNGSAIDLENNDLSLRLDFKY